MNRPPLKGPEDHFCDNAPDSTPAGRYSLLMAGAMVQSHQPSAVTGLADILRERFNVETVSIWSLVKDRGYIAGQDEIRRRIAGVDVLLMYAGKPVFDFAFYRELKRINPGLVLVHVDGDAHINFPTYTEHFLSEIDLFATHDSIDTADYVAQLGCRSICLGSRVGSDDFFPIPGTTKDIAVSFYGVPKGDRREFLRALDRAGVGLQCVGKSFGPRLDHRALVEIINRSKIGLAFNKHNAPPDKVRMPRGFNLSRQLKGHIFEYALCGTFPLTEHVDNIGRFFDVGRELVTFEGERDLIDKARYYLEHEQERETIARACCAKVLNHIEGRLQSRKLANLIIKVVNAKRGLPERFTSDATRYELKPISAQGRYRPSRQHFVNVQTSLIMRLWRRGSYRAAIRQLRCLKYGLPILYLRSQLKYAVFGFLGRARQRLRVWRDARAER